ncbi:MAG: O-methyltransferase [Bacteroidales bacterium]|nr:O-methyltransferase [Bacteroidales bacterium]
MNNMLSSLIEYAEQHSTPESELLKELYRQTHLKIYNPRMISGFLQGRILAMISRMIRPQYVLEIGTYTGYSALCLAEGLLSNGQLHTIEIDDELEEFILQYFNRSAFKKNLILHIGNALDIIPQLDIVFDLVYIDGDKREYLKYLHVVLPKVKQNGFIVADNMFWNGKVVDNEQDDIFTCTIRQFNDTVLNHPQLEVLMLPIRDGISIIRKKDM